MTVPALGYVSGDDDHGLDEAADAFAQRLAAEAGTPLETWRRRGDEVEPAELGVQLATAPLFGAGAVGVIVEPGPLLRSAESRDATIAALDTVAPGNGLVFLDPLPTGGRLSAASVALRDAVATRGGDVREVRAPSEGRMTGWIEAQARERGLRLGPGAAAALAERVGAAVREGDVDRRQMSAQAVRELEKLALYRAGEAIGREDVQAVVGETVPASTWAFLDAIGSRRGRRAASLLDALLDTTPEPVLVAQLHRRLRDLIAVRDLLASGTPEAGLVRALKLNPYRAKVLAGQARGWSPEELDLALEGLLDLDAAIKGADPATPRQVRLRFQLWLRDVVAPAGTGRSPSAPAAPRTG